MKKFVAVSVMLLILAGTVLVAGGCGPSAEQVAKDAMRADNKIKTVHAKFTTRQVLPRAPISQGKVAKKEFTTESKGEFDMRTGDWRVKEVLASGVVVTGLWVDQKYYNEIAGNWYEMPTSMQPSSPLSKTLSISQYLKYFKSLKKLGDVKIDGEPCYHLQAVPSMKDLIKMPGITDLLKSSTGEQQRTVDELSDLKSVFDIFVRKEDNFWKRTQAQLEMRADDSIIKLGYAEAGDRVKFTAVTTLSNFNEKLDLEPPAKSQPWPSSSAPG